MSSSILEAAKSALETAENYAHTDTQKLWLWLATAFVLALLDIADAIRYHK